jgi:hypothetical protein
MLFRAAASPLCRVLPGTELAFVNGALGAPTPAAALSVPGPIAGAGLQPFTPTRPPAENTAEKQRVRQQMLARNWHDDAISPELGSFCQKSHLIAGLIDLS